MVTKDYKDLLRSLMEEYCMNPEDIVYVQSVYDWCKREGIPEPDRKKPVKLVRSEGKGCRMVISEMIPNEVVEERVNAMQVRGTLQNVALDRSELLNSEKKKLLYLFINEYALGLPEHAEDELLADNWTFDELKKLGFFKE